MLVYPPGWWHLDGHAPELGDLAREGLDQHIELALQLEQVDGPGEIRSAGSVRSKHPESN